VRAILGALATDHTPGLQRTSIWPLALLTALAMFSFGWNWPSDFPEARYPAALTRKYPDVISGSRIFTTDGWADYLTFHYYPRQQVFVDGRSDFFGREISEQYLQILKGQFGWDALMKQYGFNAALIPTQSALASLLRIGSDWVVVDDDGQAALFRRR
jgi:hypothetical protein